MKCKTDKPERHKDGSGQHHPMGVFPIEQQVEHFGHCPLSRYFPFASVRADINAPIALSRSVGIDRSMALRSETPNRIATLRMVSGFRFMRFAISSMDFEEARVSSGGDLPHKTSERISAFASFPLRLQFPQFQSIAR